MSPTLVVHVGDATQIEGRAPPAKETFLEPEFHSHIGLPLLGVVRDRGCETAERRVTELGDGGRGASRRPAHFRAQGNLWSDQILDAAAKVIGEAIAERQNSMGIKMFASDAGDDEWKQLRVRRGNFVQQA